jgi:hypothetical protein
MGSGMTPAILRVKRALQNIGDYGFCPVVTETDYDKRKITRRITAS